MNHLIGNLGGSPELFPYSFDKGYERLSFIRLTEKDYERASFLDSRLLNLHPLAGWLDWADTAASIATNKLTESCGFIFHIGHVGSTLLSRLLGAHPGVFALREPMILRSLSQISRSTVDFEIRIAGSIKLLSRTFDPRQTAMIKVTSFVSEISDSLMARMWQPKALMMYVTPETYLATILGGPNSRHEAKVLSPIRIARLHQRLGREVWSLLSLSEGETLALAWACEMASLVQATEIGRGRMLPVNFDEFLANPKSSLQTVLDHFGLDVDMSLVSAILEGPDMQKYSKAPEHAYDAALRLEVLNEARILHATEIARGLKWLERAASQFGIVRSAFEFPSNSKLGT